MKVSVFKFLYPYFYKLKLPLFISLAFACLGEIFSRIAAFYGSRLIGLISSTTDDKLSILPQAVFYVCLFAVLMAIRGVAVNFSIWIDAYFLPSIQAKVYKDLFAMTHKKSSEFFEQEMSGNIASKIENVVSGVERFYYAVIWSFINPLIVLIISIICISLVDISLALILLGLMLIYIFLIYKSSQIIIPYSLSVVKANSKANGELVDSLINADMVKSFGSRFFEKKNYFYKLLEIAKAERKELNINAWICILQATIRTLIQASLCVIPLYYWYKGKMSFENFVFVQTVVATLIHIFNSMLEKFMKLFSRYSIIYDGLSLLLKDKKIIEKKGASALKINKGKIEIKNIDFAYESLSPIFSKFSLSIPAGKKYGLVGCSGSGKSTLIKLINRHYDILSGEILIDGQGIKDVTLRSLHQNIAVIPQEPSLFNRTIIENIRYGRLDATDKEVFAAAKKAHCHDFIINLPKGYNSKVGERGVMLSGGERQRIAIARAILRDAPILILDEATSALDSQSEKYIQESLADLMKGKTVIAIAHRLSTLNKMDRIVVLDQGKIAEEGTHQTLIKEKGIYHKYYNMQS